MSTRDYFTLLKKAKNGDHEAQFHVGHHYYRLQEFKKAHSWWLKCSKQNKSLGPLFNVGNLYFNGWGVRRNIKKALYYFKIVISKKIKLVSVKEKKFYIKLSQILPYIKKIK